MLWPVAHRLWKWIQELLAKRRCTTSWPQQKRPGGLSMGVSANGDSHLWSCYDLSLILWWFFLWFITGFGWFIMIYHWFFGGGKPDSCWSSEARPWISSSSSPQWRGSCPSPSLSVAYPAELKEDKVDDFYVNISGRHKRSQKCRTLQDCWFRLMITFWRVPARGVHLCSHPTWQYHWKVHPSICPAVCSWRLQNMHKMTGERENGLLKFKM